MESTPKQRFPPWIKILKKWSHFYGQQMRQIFEHMDKDKDGFLNKEELRQSLIEIDKQNFNEEDVEIFLAYADTNGDGKIDYGEYASKLLNLLLEYSPNNSPFAALKEKWERFNNVKLREVFNHLDTDKDGVISKDELRAALIELDKDNFNEEDVELVMNNSDTNKDGVLDYTEFTSKLIDSLVEYHLKWTKVHEKYATLQDQKLREAFKSIDKNGDGLITKDEFYIALKEMDPANFVEDDAEVLFEYADVDENGGIDFEEFTNHLVEVLRKYISL